MTDLVDSHVLRHPSEPVQRKASIVVVRLDYQAYVPQRFLILILLLTFIEVVQGTDLTGISITRSVIDGDHQ